MSHADNRLAVPIYKFGEKDSKGNMLYRSEKYLKRFGGLPYASILNQNKGT